ncbi:MAG: hypothetical protein ACKV1O_25760 [Saprospiraceae bacterium]
MNPSGKLKVLLADDRRADLAAAQSALLARSAGEELSPGMMAALAFENLDIRCFATAPAAIQYIRDNGAPDFSVIDIDFSESKGEAPEQGEAREEGLGILAVLHEVAPDAPFVCFSNFVASLHHRLAEARVLEHAIGKSNREALTVEAIAGFRVAALRHLQHLDASKKAHLLDALEKTPVAAIPDIELKINGQIFLVRHLLIGWAEAYWDDDAEAIALRFPENIGVIIKTLIQST